MNSFLISFKARQWWLTLLAVDVLMLISTYVVYLPKDQRFRYAGLFSLAGEMNFAAWCSGIQLLLAGIAFLSFSMFLWDTNRAQAKALGAIGIVAVILFADEVGSLHERMYLFLNMDPETDLNILPYFLLLLGFLTYGLKGLFQYRAILGTAWIRVIATFSFFTLVYVQEKIEHALEWSGTDRGIRAVFEEGTELIGFAILLSAAVTVGHRLNIQKRVKNQQGGSIPVLVPTFAGIQHLLIASMIAAVPLIALRLMYSPELLQLRIRGDFGYLPVVAIYGLAALLCYRSSLFEQARQWQWRFATFICLILSINATALFHRHVVQLANPQHLLFPWRAEIDLLWTIPLSIVMLTFIAGKKSLLANGFLLLFWVGAAGCIQLTDGLQIITYSLVLVVAFTVCSCLATSSPENKTELVKEKWTPMIGQSNQLFK